MWRHFVALEDCLEQVVFTYSRYLLLFPYLISGAENQREDNILIIIIMRNEIYESS